MDPVNAADCRLLLSLLKYAIVPPDQLERVEGWIRAKEAALSGTERMEKELREMARVHQREIFDLALAADIDGR